MILLDMNLNCSQLPGCILLTISGYLLKLICLYKLNMKMKQWITGILRQFISVNVWYEKNIIEVVSLKITCHISLINKIMLFSVSLASNVLFYTLEWQVHIEGWKRKGSNCILLTFTGEGKMIYFFFKNTLFYYNFQQ